MRKKYFIITPFENNNIPSSTHKLIQYDRDGNVEVETIYYSGDRADLNAAVLTVHHGYEQRRL